MIILNIPSKINPASHLVVREKLFIDGGVGPIGVSNTGSNPVPIKLASFPTCKQTPSSIKGLLN